MKTEHLLKDQETASGKTKNPNRYSVDEKICACFLSKNTFCAYFFCLAPVFEGRIPPEKGSVVGFLSAYEQFKDFMDNRFEMPDSTIALIVRFLEQNEGKLTKRARTNEFKDLSAVEIEEIELSYEQLFLSK